MAFHKLDMERLVAFNSAASSELLMKYDNHVNDMLIAKSSEVPSRSFSPSAFRCDRRSWFKLRGVDPDVSDTVDRVLEFSAEIGTACHRIVQTNLREALQSDWIDVSEYVSNLSDSSKYVCESRDDGLETLISIDVPPVRFACDGVVRLNDQLYLLEIKSAEYSSWTDLKGPKAIHIDQVNCYATLLELDKALFIYIDRQYGGMKCYEHIIHPRDKDIVLTKFNTVMTAVERNIAPEGLPVGDAWCSPSYCPYHKKCKEYGR